MARHTLKPGQIVDRSGVYRDQKSGEKTTLVEGKRVLPTPEPKSEWREVYDSHPERR